MQSLLNNQVKQTKWPITFSIGAATYIPPQSVDELVQKTDELMYAVKREGKNRLLHMEFGRDANG
ncbi:MAG: diguanylate cyclase [Deltaproteobacteria bacterium]|nr:diguanylate cyclase [Deltaproteobacteria bacterium]